MLLNSANLFPVNKTGRLNIICLNDYLLSGNQTLP